jgi:flagella basal body P-ring formation protein FlgA
MVFQTSRLTLTAQGKALQDGSKGDTIRVLNAKTHKTIDGTVVNSGTVNVKSAGHVALR